MALDEIYTQILTEHNNSKRNKHPLAHPTVSLKGFNPSCGDEIVLELEEREGLIADAAFTGSGCAISQASTSIMIDLIRGKTVEEAKELAKLFMGMIRKEITDEGELEALEDAVALKSIAHMPARVKCAVLGWHTLENAVGPDGGLQGEK